MLISQQASYRFVFAAFLIAMTFPAERATAQPVADPRHPAVQMAEARIPEPPSGLPVPFGGSPRALAAAGQVPLEGGAPDGRPRSRYQRLAFDEVIIYEFLMPLTNEPQLRATLDSLFYKDTIIARLKAIGVPKLQQHFAKQPDETDDQYYERVCAWVDDHFVGYSIYHVDGRFRGHRLIAQEEVAALHKTGQRYLLDETTAVTRFIFPCHDHAEAALVRYFVDTLFAESIVELTSAEDEIWMIESGMKNRVHIWRKVPQETAAAAR